MAPHTTGELASGMVHGDHIRRKNYEFISVKGLAPTPVFSHGPDLHLGNLGPVAYGGRTLETARGGYVPEFTYAGSLGPSLITGQGQDFHLGSQTAMSHGNLAQGMACGGHIILGNHEIA